VPCDLREGEGQISTSEEEEAEEEEGEEEVPDE
jgi:hypothetical protein